MYPLLIGIPQVMYDKYERTECTRECRDLALSQQLVRGTPYMWHS